MSKNNEEIKASIEIKEVDDQGPLMTPTLVGLKNLAMLTVKSTYDIAK